jgi:hypothetical protein
MEKKKLPRVESMKKEENMEKKVNMVNTVKSTKNMPNIIMIPRNKM